jgi:hypothetical protein
MVQTVLFFGVFGRSKNGLIIPCSFFEFLKKIQIAVLNFLKFENCYTTKKRNQPFLWASSAEPSPYQVLSMELRAESVHVPWHRYGVFASTRKRLYGGRLQQTSLDEWEVHLECNFSIVDVFI